MASTRPSATPIHAITTLLRSTAARLVHLFISKKNVLILTLDTLSNAHHRPLALLAPPQILSARSPHVFGALAVLAVPAALDPAIPVYSVEARSVLLCGFGLVLKHPYTPHLTLLTTTTQILFAALYAVRATLRDVWVWPFSFAGRRSPTPTPALLAPPPRAACPPPRAGALVMVLPVLKRAPGGVSAEVLCAEAHEETDGVGVSPRFGMCMGGVGECAARTREDTVRASAAAAHPDVGSDEAGVVIGASLGASGSVLECGLSGARVWGVCAERLGRTSGIAALSGCDRSLPLRHTLLRHTCPPRSSSARSSARGCWARRRVADAGSFWADDVARRALGAGAQNEAKAVDADDGDEWCGGVFTLGLVVPSSASLALFCGGIWEFCGAVCKFHCGRHVGGVEGELRMWGVGSTSVVMLGVLVVPALGLVPVCSRAGLGLPLHTTPAPRALTSGISVAATPMPVPSASTPGSRWKPNRTNNLHAALLLLASSDGPAATKARSEVFDVGGAQGEERALPSPPPPPPPSTPASASESYFGGGVRTMSYVVLNIIFFFDKTWELGMGGGHNTE
ncbi:hypothetical protein C8F04DRAFT_1179770 [Mycena alexandri]|uniref:Uncharacterized protein n=1 Tax=Mycena alexandri TaxID=1745969 RepID=A0AAD6X6I8_9AGAR|nr:hypothetical protein C8F04DRAFT_1179770 [Mycena alexandri]